MKLQVHTRCRLDVCDLCACVAVIMTSDLFLPFVPLPCLPLDSIKLRNNGLAKLPVKQPGAVTPKTYRLF